MKKLLFTLVALFMATVAFADSHANGWWLVLIDANGEEVWCSLQQNADDSYVTTVTLNYVDYGPFYWNPELSSEENNLNRPNVPYYFVVDGVRYGADEDNAVTHIGNTMNNPLFENENHYTVPVGYTYVLGIYVDNSFETAEYYVYCAQGAQIEINEETAAPTFNGYTTDGIHAYFVEINETEPSTIYYRVQFPDGEWTEWAEYEEILSFTGNGKYRVEAYAVAPGKAASTEIAYEFVVSPFTGIAEMNADKAVASVRYFNMAGQEMQQANGLTIMVTTYTDGTTNAVKVVK